MIILQQPILITIIIITIIITTIIITIIITITTIKTTIEEELQSLRGDLGEMKRARDELRLKLRKKEWECEDRQKERDRERSNVDKLEQKLTRKGDELTEAWTRQQEVMDQMGQLQNRVSGGVLV